jgi:hypothetical protein
MDMRKGRTPWSSRIGMIGGCVLVGWFGLAVVQAGREMAVLMPPRPLTPAELARVRPRAEADWPVVYRRLAARLPEPPPELGEVWAMRTGRICGFVDDRESGVDDMTRFYTTGGIPHLKDDDHREYLHAWTECLNDRAVELHAGTEQTGFCATRRGRNSFIGRHLFCLGGAQ